jgi:hypothetical protein
LLPRDRRSHPGTLGFPGSELQLSGAPFTKAKGDPSGYVTESSVYNTLYTG